MDADAPVVGGPVSVNPTYSFDCLLPQSDGTFRVFLTVSLDGALRKRYLDVAADGTVSSLDGARISSVPPELAAWAASIVTMDSSALAALGAAAVQSLLNGP